MRAIDKHRIANRHSADDLEIFGFSLEDEDEVDVFGVSVEEGVKTASNILTEAGSLGKKLSGDKSQQYSQYQQPYYPQYQQPQKSGLPDWAVYALGAAGVLGIGYVGYKVIKG